MQRVILLTARGHRVKDDCSTVMNMNFMAGMEKSDSELFRISPEQRKPSILLHACCGPCSTACVERLAPDYQITVYYYNPNITDREEYYLRRDTLMQFIKAFNEEHKDSYFVSYMEGEYDPERYIAKCGPLADEPEGGARCDDVLAVMRHVRATVYEKSGIMLEPEVRFVNCSL